MKQSYETFKTSQEHFLHCEKNTVELVHIFYLSSPSFDLRLSLQRSQRNDRQETKRCARNHLDAGCVQRAHYDAVAKNSYMSATCFDAVL